MTVIAWDGQTLAADKQSTVYNRPHTVTKIFKIDQVGLVALSGNANHAMKLLEWCKQGRNPDTWPAPTKPEEDAAIYIISCTKEVLKYYGGPYPERLEDKYFSAGSGGDYAYAAMYCNKTAYEAVELACKLDINCGNGINVLTL